MFRYERGWMLLERKTEIWLFRAISPTNYTVFPHFPSIAPSSQWLPVRHAPSRILAWPGTGPADPGHKRPIYSTLLFDMSPPLSAFLLLSIPVNNILELLLEFCLDDGQSISQTATIRPMLPFTESLPLGDDPNRLVGIAGRDSLIER
jgi:hypothetical protein